MIIDLLEIGVDTDFHAPPQFLGWAAEWRGHAEGNHLIANAADTWTRLRSCPTSRGTGCRRSGRIRLPVASPAAKKIGRGDQYNEAGNRKSRPQRSATPGPSGKPDDAE